MLANGQSGSSNGQRCVNGCIAGFRNASVESYFKLYCNAQEHILRRAEMLFNFLVHEPSCSSVTVKAAQLSFVENSPSKPVWSPSKPVYCISNLKPGGSAGPRSRRFRTIPGHKRDSPYTDPRTRPINDRLISPRNGALRAYIWR